MNQKSVPKLGSGALTNYTVVQMHTATLKWVVALLPLISSIAIVGLRNIHFESYWILFAEDSLFESLTSVIYFGAAATAIAIALAFKRKGRFTLATAYLLLSFGFLFVAGEEISWGQRILKFETPEAFLELNSQREATIHNLEPVQRILHSAYILVGAYGAFFWLLALPQIGLLQMRISSYVIPRWYLATYFLPVFALYTHFEVATLETEWFRYRSPDQEPAEFILSLGFLLFVLSNLFRQKLEFSLYENRIFNVSWRSPESRAHQYP